MDWNTATIYFVYLMILAADLLAGHFNIINPTLSAATFTLVIGHFMGLQVIPPSMKKSLVVTAAAPLPLDPQQGGIQQ